MTALPLVLLHRCTVTATSRTERWHHEIKHGGKHGTATQRFGGRIEDLAAVSQSRMEVKLGLRLARAERMRLQSPAEHQLHTNPSTRAVQLLVVPFALALLAVQLSKSTACSFKRIAADIWEVISDSSEPKSQKGRPDCFAPPFARKHIVREIDGVLHCGHETCFLARNRRMPCGHLLSLTGVCACAPPATPPFGPCSFATFAAGLLRVPVPFALCPYCSVPAHQCPPTVPPLTLPPPCCARAGGECGLGDFDFCHLIGTFTGQTESIFWNTVLQPHGAAWPADAELQGGVRITASIRKLLDATVVEAGATVPPAAGASHAAQAQSQQAQS